MYYYILDACSRVIDHRNSLTRLPGKKLVNWYAFLFIFFIFFLVLYWLYSNILFHILYIFDKLNKIQLKTEKWTLFPPSKMSKIIDGDLNNRFGASVLKVMNIACKLKVTITLPMYEYWWFFSFFFRYGNFWALMNILLLVCRKLLTAKSVCHYEICYWYHQWR